MSKEVVERIYEEAQKLAHGKEGWDSFYVLVAYEIHKAYEWKEAVIDACMNNSIGWDEYNPRKTLNDLMAWEQQVALDPVVSGAAADLIKQGDTKDKICDCCGGKAEPKYTIYQCCECAG